ncbi:protein CURVATURE THYLAKOID 1A, chloroplastic-like [Panicum miliaceum]|uniref:Protein CURVATURE THYLAKOID 1A, chloroplastic-like n=1 Tax=Panicum miliaceum TaxID=4540 RepID=A0A3L6RKZ5_PANMI|nr:protein CURVATURE THYLAKOID 1A, chloroplastic-like [Panicum miliaceum]
MVKTSLTKFHSSSTASLKISQLQLTATRFSKESDSAEDDELLSELREKWDAMENKSSLLLYGGGAIFALWICLVVVRALDSVPLLPGLLELVGLGYSGWFVYRYLLFQENRKELANNLDALKKRITGDDE